MKNMYLFLIAIAFLGILWIAKKDTKDRKARKEAIRVTATISELRCKQRLKGDKSLVKLKYKNKDYVIFLKDEKKCFKWKLKDQISVYYSKTYDMIFLSL